MTRWDIRPLTLEEIGAAQVWYKRYQTVVDSLLRYCENVPPRTVLSVAISPGGEDAPHPKLWKYNHWKWFDNQGHLKTQRGS